MTEIMKSISR